MYKLFVVFFLFSVCTACKNDGPSGRELATEVCECYKKANALATADPQRTREQDACIIRQGEAWEKVKNNKKEADSFNDELADCKRATVSGSMEE
jgi:hypothetical protein